MLSCVKWKKLINYMGKLITTTKVMLLMMVACSRHSINLSAPTLPWCSNQRDSITSPPKILYAEGSLNDSSSSFQTLVAGQHYVYSAYYDDRLEASSAGGGVVRVIAVLRTAGGTATAPTPTLFCHVDITSDDWSLASVLMLMMWRLAWL